MKLKILRYGLKILNKKLIQISKNQKEEMK